MKANREYKSTLFSKLFSDTDNLRELYNAIADTDYDKDTPIYSTFLTEHGYEVNNMLMTEYNVDRALEIRDERHRTEIAEKDAKIANKDAKIAEKDAEIKQLQARLSEFEK